MKKFGKFGAHRTDMEILVDEVSKVLSVDAEHRSSDYSGDYVVFQCDDETLISIQNNYSEFDEEFNEPNFKDFPFLIGYIGVDDDEVFWPKIFEIKNIVQIA